MTSCDCPTSTPIETSQALVCCECGVVLDQLYEKNPQHKEVSHFANPIIGTVHPSVNKTLSYLSSFVDMSKETRLEIIDRAYQLYDPTINFVMSTKYAFKEMFPEINIDLDESATKKVEKIKENHTPCGPDCDISCVSSYRNNYLLNKITKVRKLIQIGKKNNRTIDETLKRVRFPRRTYYRYKDIEFKHKKNKKYHSKKITRKIEELIFQPNKTAIEIRVDIYFYHRVNISEATILRYKRKNKKPVLL